MTRAFCTALLLLACARLAHGDGLGPPEALVSSADVLATARPVPAPKLAPILRRVRYCTGSETVAVHCKSRLMAESEGAR